jgi:hypothetical protein
MKKILILPILLILVISTVMGAAEYTQTMVQFNIQSTLAYTLTLPGESTTTSDPTAASAATTDIYFNSTAGNDKAVEAKVAGGTVQSDGVPIFQFINTGTINITISVYLNDTTNSCIKLLGNDTYRDAANGTQIIGVTNTTVDNALGVGEPAHSYYLWANFTNCYGGNEYRKLFSTGYT